MADLSTESIQRIADTRRDAETELKKALSGVRESDDVAPYLSAFTSFASVLFDVEAGELLPVCEDADRFHTALQNEVGPRIIEAVLPDRGLNRVTGRRTDEVKRLSIEHDMDTDLLWEVGSDGTRKPARAEVRGVYAQHRDWENFMPKGVRFLVRWPNNNATVRAALSQALQQRAEYWAGQFQLRSTAGGRGARTRLRRVSYPFHYWLYDHSHEPVADTKPELEYWKAHVWRGYHVLVENYERMEMAWADRHEKLNSATAGLS